MFFFFLVFKFAVHLGLRETLFPDWTHCTITNVFPKNGRFAGGLEPGMLCNSAINAQNSRANGTQTKKSQVFTNLWTIQCCAGALQVHRNNQGVIRMFQKAPIKCDKLI